MAKIKLTVGYASTHHNWVEAPWELLDLADKSLYKIKQNNPIPS